MSDDQEFVHVDSDTLITSLQSILPTFDHIKFPNVKKAVDSAIDLWSRYDLHSDDWVKTADAVHEITWDASMGASREGRKFKRDTGGIRDIRYNIAQRAGMIANYAAKYGRELGGKRAWPEYGEICVLRAKDLKEEVENIK